jgi:hypothetical protein
MSNLTPDVMKVIDTWVEPRGFVLCNQNTEILLDGIRTRFGNKFSHANLTQVAVEAPNGVWQKGFSPAEKNAVWKAWWAQAPKELLGEQANAGPLLNYLDAHCGGVYSIPNLNLAYENVKSKLKFQQPKSLEEVQREFEEKEYRRIQREKAENLKPFDHTARAAKVDKERAAQANAKNQEQAQRGLDEFIANFYVNAKYPGAIDHAMSQECRKVWSAVKIGRGGKYDALLTLAVVRRASSMLSDYPNPAEIRRAVQQATEMLIAAQDAKPDEGPIR